MSLTQHTEDMRTLCNLKEDEAEVAQRTEFRISIPELILGTVSMIGINMGYDHDVYLMPLTPNETLKWGWC